MSNNDKAWTADDIRGNAPNWSLQCDGKLLEYMQNLSKTIEERGNRTTHSMHNSMLELDRTKVALENATNQLMALQHKQFIENRVYDDDETLANIDSVPTTNPNEIEQPKMSMTEALQNAITTGMQMVDKYFDKVTIELSDSEDDGEDLPKSVIFRPKSLYEHRPLPYLIGSKDWHEKWHIGLIDEDSDGSGNENVDDEASISSSSLSSLPGVSISSNVPVSLSESENRTGATSFRKAETQDLFQSSSEENISKLPHEEINSTFHKRSIDAPKIEQNIKSIDVNTSNTIFRQQKPPNVSHIIPTLIDSEPPELDDVLSTRAVHKPANLFLDDENDPDDFNIFDDKTTKGGQQSSGESEKESIKKATSNINQQKSINLFVDDDDDNFDSFLSPKSTSNIAANTVKSTSKIPNIFDDDDDDFDDELFLQPSESAISKSKTPTSIFSNPTPKQDVFSNNLFNDEPPDDDFDIETPKNIEKLQSPIFKDSIEKPKLITSSEKPKIDTTSVAVKKSTDLFNNKVNLFDDDEDDDAFEKLIASNKNKKPIENKEVIFESENIENEPTGKKDKKTPENQSHSKSNVLNPVNLFSDTPPNDDDDEQLFGNILSQKGDVSKMPAESLKQKTEFYNDFSDTVTVGNTLVTKSTIASPSHEKSFYPEPEKRPSKEPKNTETESSGTDGLPGGKRSDFLKKLDAFSKPSSNIDKAETVTNPKPQPKKLNIGKMDINVAALLPGAKLTKSIDRSDSMSKDSADEISHTDESDVSTKATTISTVTDQDNVDDSGRLTNLNRNRAKNLARRPSTRAGRRQQYQKSLQSEENTDESMDQIDKPDLVPANRNINAIQITRKLSVSSTTEEATTTINQIPPHPPNIYENSSNSDPKPKIESKLPKVETKSPTKTVIFDDGLFASDLPPEDIAISTKKTETIEKSKILAEDPPLEQPKNPQIVETSEQSNVKDNKEKNVFSFLDDPDDEDDDFLTVQPKATPEPVVKSEVSVRATPAYIDELPPELDPIEEKSSSGKNIGASSFLSENALSLFGDDEDDDFDSGAIFTSEKSINPPVPSTDVKNVEDDWSPYPQSKNPEIATPSSSSEEKPISSNVPGLFDDNSDNDELFGEPTTPISTKVEPKEQKPPQKHILLANAVPKSSLFGDDDDDDDLFSEPPPLPEPVKQPQSKKAATKIFSSDSSDDDLFGGGKSNKKNSSKSNPPPTTSKIAKATKENKSSDKLFSDSEDDDLFGTKSKPKDIVTKKVLPVSTSSKPVKEDAQKTIKTLSQSAADNDPLADLLK